MSQFSLVGTLIIFFLTTPVFSSDNDRLENNYPFKRKINDNENANIANQDINHEKRLKRNNQNINQGEVPQNFQEYNRNDLTFQINDYFEKGKTDNNYLLQKVKEFENFCVNDLYVFSNACTDIDIINDIMNGSFISNYKLLIETLTEEREGERENIKSKKASLSQLVYLKNIYSIEEFYHIIKNLSEIYRNSCYKKQVKWVYQSKLSALTLDQAFNYIIFVKNGQSKGNISLIRKKAAKEGNKIIPPILRNQLPNDNENVQPINIDPVNNDNGYQVPIPQNQYYGYQLPFPQPNQNLGINNNNYRYQAPMPQPLYNAEAGNNNIQKPQPLSIDDIEKYLKYIDPIDDQVDIQNLLNKAVVPEWEKEQKKVTTQDGRTNFNSNPFIPSFHNIQQIRDFYNIKPNGVVSIEDLEQAKKNAKGFDETLLPNNFPLSVIYPKRAEIKEIPTVKLYENMEDWTYIDKYMRLYIAIRNKAKELNIQKILTQQELSYIERNMIDIQQVLSERSKIFLTVRNMIQTNQFKCYFFNNNLAAIHIENGYLTDKKIYQGFVGQDGTPNYDGVQIQERLDTYHAIYSQAYDLAIELGEDKLISFFKAFSNAQCLDARIYPLQILLSEMQRDKELMTSTMKTGFKLTKLEVFDSKFFEEYKKGTEQEKIIENMKEFFINKDFDNELVNTQEIVDFVNEKYKQIEL